MKHLTDKQKEKLIHIIFYFETGKAQVVGRIYGWWNEPMIIFIFLKSMGLELPMWTFIFFVGFMIIATTIVGRLYIMKNYFKLERKVRQKQDPVITQIQKDVREIRKWIKKQPN